MKTKKILAILLSLALLVGLVPVAGVLTTTAAEDSDGPTVTLVDFTQWAAKGSIADPRWVVSNWYATTNGFSSDVVEEMKTNGAFYTVSFDYYLESATNVAGQHDTSSTSLGWLGGYQSYVSGDTTLEPGYHSYSVVCKSTYTTTNENNANMMCRPTFINAAGDAKLYVWNIKVELNGKQITHSYGGDGVWWEAQSTAVVTQGNGLYTYPWAPNADGSAKACEIYLSASGSDENDGLTADTAVATPSMAFALIENAAYYTKGVINIVGTYSAADQYTFASDATKDTNWTTEYTKPVTIQGTDSSAVLELTTKSSLFLYGPTVFDNITIKTLSSGFTFYADKQNITFGENVVLNTGWTSSATGGIRPDLLAGDYGRSTIADPTPGDTALTVNGGTLMTVRLGNSCVNSAYTTTQNNLLGGVDYVQNAGSIYRLMVGASGNDATWNNRGTKYLGDVNITINGGTIGTVEGGGGLYIQDDTWVSGTNYRGETNPSDLDGHAVQILFNNGTASSNYGVVPTAADAKAMNGVLYMLSCEAVEGSSLSVTETAGTYTVNGDKLAIAKSESGAAYYSVDGKLTVPAGTYTVAFKDSLYAGSVYVDYENGSDDNMGSSATDAVKTLSAALALASNESAPTITVVNKAVYTNAAPINSKATVTFVGATDGAILTYGGVDMTLKSNVILQNLVLSQDVDNGKLYTNGYDLQIGDAVTFTHGDFAGLENPVIVTGKDGDESESLVLVGSGCAGLTVGDTGATRILLDGTTVDTLTLDSANAASSVKAIVDGGQIKAVSLTDGAVYAALQVLALNGGTILGAQAADNAWYITADDGIDVSLTDTAGTVNVTAPADKHVVAIGGNGAYVAGDKTAADETPVTDYINTTYTDWGCFDNNGSYLVNTYNKLKNDKQLNVVYFGGSITNGFGVGQDGDPNGSLSCNTHSWRALSGQWLTEAFPEAQINLYDCAIGESGTFLGVYRLQDDIIAKKPDLLFIEYAMNDNYHGSSKATAALQFETIVREVRQALPDCDIVTVLTTDKTRMSLSYNGELFDQAAGHYAIAEAYGLPVMNIGVGLAKGIAAAENNAAWWSDSEIWAKYFYDSVHPYSTGHEQYYLCVREFLENNLLHTALDGMTATRDTLPAVQSAYLLDGDRDTYMGSAMQALYVAESSTGVTYSTGTFTGGSSDTSRDGYYEVAAGGTITFKLTGTEVAVWTNMAQNGTYSCSIDGGDAFTLTEGGHSPTIIQSGLASGEHTVSITPSATIKIAGVFERDETKQTAQGAIYTYPDYVGATLTVPAGSYRITYAATVADLPDPISADGAFFLGWQYADGTVPSKDTVLTKGMTLTAVWATCAADDHTTAGTQIREKDGALRFLVEMDDSLYAALLAVDTNAVRGTVVLPTVILGEGELTVGGAYTYNDKAYSAATVPAVNILLDGDGFDRYTVALTNIPNAQTQYTVRGYVTYTDLNGVTRTAYTAAQTDSQAACAERAINEIVNSGEAYTEEDIAYLRAIVEA